ncbi:MAG: hypothetical protein M1818_003612 [Claussenomyces sp. TS43310]|nr:MAG: hypothetical protein M1818_003612 [Claussenomyces sp. TS43310]
MSELPPSEDPGADHPPSMQSDARLSLPPAQRIALATAGSFMVGAGLGLSHGAQSAGFRFRAEHAHRLPQTQTGWYLYHKSKNYNMALGGVREGLRMGGRTAFWVAAFCAIENGWDEVRGGSKDFFNTMMASLTVAGGFSLWNRFPVATAARTTKLSLAIGIGFGLCQDVIGMLRGRRPAYVDFILRGGKRKDHAQQMELT